MADREFRHVESGMMVRDPIVADDWYVTGAVVHYRDHGGPWKVYGSGEYADSPGEVVSPADD